MLDGLKPLRVAPTLRATPNRNWAPGLTPTALRALTLTWATADGCSAGGSGTEYRGASGLLFASTVRSRKWTQHIPPLCKDSP